MKTGDLVRYKISHLTLHLSMPSDSLMWGKGLLVEFDKTQRLCVILDNTSGKIVKRHCSDVQLVKVGYERSR